MKVLLATDGSDHAEHAAKLLAHLPHVDVLELHVLAVTPQLEFHGSGEVVAWMKRSEEADMAQAHEAVSRIEKIFDGADVRVTSLVTRGHVAATIVEQAAKLSADLIVLGAVGKNMLVRAMLGSVSDFVATHASCSVLVVRPKRDSSAVPQQFKLCLADDLSQAAEVAADQLANFRWGSHAHIDLVNALISPLPYSDVPIVLDTEQLRKEMLAKLDERAVKLKSLSPHVTSHVIEATHVGEGLVSFADRHNSDLLALGHTGRGLLGRFLMGSVSRYALRHAPCSVWIARPRG